MAFSDISFHSPSHSSQPTTELLKVLLKFCDFRKSEEKIIRTKPFENLTGNGCHAHISLWNGNKNLFLDKEGKIFFETVYNTQKKRIFNAIKNSNSDSVIKFIFNFLQTVKISF